MTNAIMFPKFRQTVAILAAPLKLCVKG